MSLPSSDPGERAVLGSAVPNRYRAVHELLMAYHPEDLPNREVLAQHPEAEDALVWLSKNGEPMVVRHRALTTLGSIPTASAKAALDEAAAAKDAQPGLRAAALEGMRAWSIDDIEARAAVLRSSMEDRDPRVAISAARTAVRSAALADDVARCRDSHPSRSVREALERIMPGR